MNKDELRAVLPGGKLHEVAKAWVANDDVMLQCRPEGSADACWDNICAKLFVFPGVEYRIKPKTLRYRVALMGAYTNTADTVEQERAFEERPDFIRWLGDWQEIEL